ncbi:galactose oxidase [Calocera viscosa TUFC12733]|uniref:Galactose oxidase n=1 Tax=Calocera viscosa (strain TUFC12733) TaxID=1330018 RepID=A0A167MCX6_CALVF|nr:galactose oxidase [Calocera viscosa TUFC12733]
MQLSPVSPLSPPGAFGISAYESTYAGGPSQADYLNGGVGWNVHAPPSRAYQQQQPPAPKVRGRSHTVTAAHPSSSSSPSTSPETSSAASPPRDSVHRSDSWSQKRRAAPSMMYWSRPVVHSALRPTRGVRGGSATVVDGSSVWFFGGYDGTGTMDEVWVLDTETMEWARLEFAGGRRPPPLRAHTAVLSESNLFVFGGGSGDAFSSELWMLDTIEQIWYLLPCAPTPTPRRAHISFLYDEQLYIYGGGSGVDALADLWRIDVSLPALVRAKDEPLVWEKVRTSGPAGEAVEEDGEEEQEGAPKARGYMSATLVGDVLVVLGGQSGRDGEREGPWGDCWVLDLRTMHWEEKRLNPPLPLASHSATLVGMYLFIFGGNDGSKYLNDLHLLNLMTMEWETAKIKGHAPPVRAQHQAVLVDARLWIFGGFDGKKYYDEPYVLDLAGSSYLVGVTEFEVGDDEEGWD